MHIFLSYHRFRINTVFRLLNMRILFHRIIISCIIHICCRPSTSTLRFFKISNWIKWCFTSNLFSLLLMNLSSEFISFIKFFRIISALKNTINSIKLFSWMMGWSLFVVWFFYVINFLNISMMLIMWAVHDWLSFTIIKFIIILFFILIIDRLLKFFFII